MFMNPPTIVHAVIKDLPAGEEEKPIVVFESHLGMDASCWEYVQTRLEGCLPTLAFDRLGYGYSSNPPPIQLRNHKALSNDLHDLLQTVGLIGPSSLTTSPRPFILIGHSHASLPLLSFLKTHNPPNCLALILLDPPPPSLPSTYPQISDFLTTRLPRVLSTAAKMADMGILRLLALFGVGVVASTPGRARVVDGRTIRTMQREVEGTIEGFDFLEKEIMGSGASADSTSQLSKPKKPPTRKRPKTYIISPTTPDPPLVPLPTTTNEEYAAWWKDAQKALGRALNIDTKGKGKAGESGDWWWVEDETSSSTGMCMSEKVVETVVKVVRGEGYRVDEPGGVGFVEIGGGGVGGGGRRKEN
ncbi:hypothetical protein HDV00_011065 [Rhizophlyctis rosea]|nr:hypothetical protein HDV00_011065 [Rhizophlyctis rosea]